MARQDQELEGLNAEELEAKAAEFLQRAKELKAQEVERHKRELAALEAERSEVQSRLAEIDAKVAEIRTLIRRSASATPKGVVRDKTVDHIVDFVWSAGREVTTAEVKAYLEDKGRNTKTLGQLIQYLKRKGRIESVKRGVYCKPGLLSSD